MGAESVRFPPGELRRGRSDLIGLPKPATRWSPKFTPFAFANRDLVRSRGGRGLRLTIYWDTVERGAAAPERNRRRLARSPIQRRRPVQKLTLVHPQGIQAERRRLAVSSLQNFRVQFWADVSVGRRAKCVCVAKGCGRRGPEVLVALPRPFSPVMITQIHEGLAECQCADMKSGVKREFAQGDAETEKVLATQDDVRTRVPRCPPPGVRR